MSFTKYLSQSPITSNDFTMAATFQNKNANKENALIIKSDDSGSYYIKVCMGQTFNSLDENRIGIVMVKDGSSSCLACSMSIPYENLKYYELLANINGNFINVEYNKSSMLGYYYEGSFPGNKIGYEEANDI